MERLTGFLWRRLDKWMSAHGLIAARSAIRARSVNDQFTAILLRPGRKFLHVGCGHARKADTGPGFQSDLWTEIRLDVDPTVEPDIVGTMLDMSVVPTESVDAVFSSHSLEHVYPHEVPVALREMRRVLKPDGLLVLTVPDLQSTARMIAEDRLLDTAYISAAGPIAPFDILYGFRDYVARLPYMAHHCGFTLTSLMTALKTAQFPSLAGIQREAAFDLWVLATKTPLPEEELRRLVGEYLPS